MSGKRIFTGTFCAISSAALASLHPQVPGLHAQHVRDRDAEGVGLHHRRDEPAQFRNVRPVGNSAQGVDSGQPDLHLLEYPEELFGQRASGVAGNCDSAASNGSPASTEIVSKSIESGRSRRIRSLRLYAAW